MKDFIAFTFLSFSGKIILLVPFIAILIIFGIPLGESSLTTESAPGVVYYDTSNCTTVMKNVLSCLEDTGRNTLIREE